MCKKDVCISSSFDEDENSKPTTSNSPQFFSESDPLVPRRQFSDCNLLSFSFLLFFLFLSFSFLLFFLWK